MSAQEVEDPIPWARSRTTAPSGSARAVRDDAQREGEALQRRPRRHAQIEQERAVVREDDPALAQGAVLDALLDREPRPAREVAEDQVVGREVELELLLERGGLPARAARREARRPARAVGDEVDA